MSELKPASENPEFGKVCPHGQLKRKCYICELEDRLSEFEKSEYELKSKLSEAKNIADNYSVIAEKAVLMTKELEMRFYAARNVVIREIGKAREHFQEKHNMPFFVFEPNEIDQEISAELTRLKQETK